MDTKEILIIVFVAIWLLFALIALAALPVWLRALRARAAISVPKIIVMRMQGFKMSLIVDEYIRARKEGTSVSVDEIAILWRSSPRTFQADVQSLIAAKRSAPK